MADHVWSGGEHSADLTISAVLQSDGGFVALPDGGSISDHANSFSTSYTGSGGYIVGSIDGTITQGEALSLYEQQTGSSAETMSSVFIATSYDASDNVSAQNGSLVSSSGSVSVNGYTAYLDSSSSPVIPEEVSGGTIISIRDDVLFNEYYSDFIYNPANYDDAQGFIEGDTIEFSNASASDNDPSHLSTPSILSGGVYALGSDNVLSFTHIHETSEDAVIAATGSWNNLYITGNFSNSGSIEVDGAEAAQSNPELQITVSSGAFVNDGTVSTENGDLTFYGKVQNNSEISVSNGKLNIFGTGAALSNTSEGTVSITDGGTLTIDDTATNDGSIIIDGQDTKFVIGNLLSSGGSIENGSGGSLIVSNGGSINTTYENTILNDGLLSATGRNTQIAGSSNIAFAASLENGRNASAIFDGQVLGDFYDYNTVLNNGALSISDSGTVLSCWSNDDYRGSMINGSSGTISVESGAYAEFVGYYDISNSGTISISGNGTLLSGWVAGSSVGTLDNASSAVLDVGGNANVELLDYATVTNGGTLFLASATVTVTETALGQSAVLTNSSGGLVSIGAGGNADLMDYNGLINNGSFVVSGSKAFLSIDNELLNSGVFSNGSGADFTVSSGGNIAFYGVSDVSNSGTLSVAGQGAILSLTGETSASFVNTSSAQMTIDAGAELDMSGGASTDGTGSAGFASIQNAGSVLVSGGKAILYADLAPGGSFENDDTFAVVSGAHVRLESQDAVDSRGWSFNNSGTLTISGDGAELSTVADCDQGTLTNTDTMSVVSGGKVNVAAGLTTKNELQILNSSTVSLQKGAFTNSGRVQVDYQSTLSAGASLTNDVFSELDILDSSTVTGESGENKGIISVSEGSTLSLKSGSFTNSGAVSATLKSTVATDTDFKNEGTLVARESSTLKAGSAFLNSNVLSVLENSTVTAGGAVTNSGNMALMDSTLTAGGALTTINEFSAENSHLTASSGVSNAGELTLTESELVATGVSTFANGSGAKLVISGSAAAQFKNAVDVGLNMSASAGSFVNNGSISVTGGGLIFDNWDLSSGYTPTGDTSDTASGAHTSLYDVSYDVLQGSIAGAGSLSVSSGYLSLSAHDITFGSAVSVSNSYATLLAKSVSASMDLSSASQAHLQGLVIDGAYTLANSSISFENYKSVTGNVKFNDSATGGKTSAPYGASDGISLFDGIDENAVDTSYVVFRQNHMYQQQDFSVAGMHLTNFTYGDAVYLQGAQIPDANLTWQYHLNGNDLGIYSGTTEIGDLSLSVAASVTNYSFHITYSYFNYTVLPTNSTTPDVTQNGVNIKISLEETTAPIAAYEAGTVFMVACFLEDVPVMTVRGEMTAEALFTLYEAGDNVPDLVVRSGNGCETERLPVRRIMRGRISQALARKEQPVRIMRDAFGPGLPMRTVHLTEEHCIAIEKALIPLRMLVNGGTIAYEPRAEGYEIYHIETAPHAVIFAAGLPVETWLDSMNETVFSENRSVTPLRFASLPRGDGKTCLPVETGRAAVEPLWRQLSERSAVLGYAVDAPGADYGGTDPKLRVQTDCGAEIMPVFSQNGYYWFRLPPAGRATALLSKAARPSDACGPFVDDRRRLGVCVTAITQYAPATEAFEMNMAEIGLTGWHASEETARWTDGRGTLHLPETGVQGAELVVRVTGTVSYREDAMATETTRLRA